MCVWAKSQGRYVSDVLYVPLRAGPGLQYKILHRGLKSGLSVELLSNKPQKGYYFVKVDSGIKGYVPSQYLQIEPVARTQLFQLKEDNGKLRKANESLSSSLIKLREDSVHLKQQLEEQKQEKEKILVELVVARKISGKEVQLSNQLHSLTLDYEQLKNKLSTQQVMNDNVKDRGHVKWYFYGSITLFAGIMLGVVGPHLRIRKKQQSQWV